MSRFAPALRGASLALLLSGITLIAWGGYAWHALPIPTSIGDADWLWLGVAPVAAASCWVLGAVKREAPVFLVVVLGLSVAARLCYLGAERSVSLFYQPGAAWIGLGALALTLAAACDLIARRHPGSWRIAAPGAVTSLLAMALVVACVMPLYQQHLISITTNPGSQPYPSLPTSVTGEVAWSQTLPDVAVGQTRGARGPVIALTNRVIGLNAADGEVLWEHRLTAGPPCSFNQLYLTSSPLLLSSPDGAYAAFGACQRDNSSDGILHIVETTTGRIVAQRYLRRYPDVQLTNSMAWVNGEGIRLSDGSVIWTTTVAQRAGSGAVSGSLFVKEMTCTDEGETRVGTCSLELFLHSDPRNIRRVESIVRTSGVLPAAHGWVIQLAPEGPPITSRDANTAMQALHLETGETVPLGEFREVQHVSETRLVLRRADGDVAVFDPTTKTVTNYPAGTVDTISADTMWPTNDVWKANWDGPLSPNTRALRLDRVGDPVIIPVDHPAGATSLARPAAVRAWAAPGCVMVQAWSGSHPSRGEAEPDRTHLACVR
ncbi:MAG: PQQ-binding-like beta-propeller repeat protein [Propionibacteriaceae bacterium]|nr:PQQ-binding-like beta-propeller repeat protein [Propionibacteriaceae bacterium]